MRSACGSSTDLSLLDPRFAPYAIAFVDALLAVGIRATVTSARRTHATQQCLFDRYKSGASPYPALPPGRSMHELGLAFDLDVQPRGLLPVLGDVWKAWSGGQWGGDAKIGYDPVHFQMKQLKT